MSFASIFAGRDSARVDIPVLGDSITFGRDASGYPTIWPQLLNGLIRAAYPTTANGSKGGIGFIPAYSTDDTILFDWPITWAGTLNGLLDLGPVRGGLDLQAAASGTWTAPAGTTSVQLCFYDAFAGATFSAQVNSGAPVNIVGAGTALDALSESIPMNGGDTLTIAWVSGNVLVTGIMHYAGDEHTGITFHGCGRSGWCAGTESGVGWNVPEEFDLNWAQAFANAFPNTLGMVILLGTNDGNTAEGDRTGPQFQSDLEALIATVRGAAPVLAGIPLLLVGAWELEATWADAGGWAAYVTAIANAAAADGNAQFIDLASVMPSAFTVPYPSIYQPGDVGHPNDAGELVIAQTIFQALAPAAAAPSSLPVLLAATCRGR